MQRSAHSCRHWPKAWSSRALKGKLQVQVRHNGYRQLRALVTCPSTQHRGMLCLRGKGGVTPGTVWPGAGVPNHAWQKSDLHHLGHIAEHRVTRVFDTAVK